jgi:hypothetical protein
VYFVLLLFKKRILFSQPKLYLNNMFNSKIYIHLNSQTETKKMQIWHMISIENHTSSSNMKCVTLQIVKEKKNKTKWHWLSAKMKCNIKISSLNLNITFHSFFHLCSCVWIPLKSYPAHTFRYTWQPNYL